MKMLTTKMRMALMASVLGLLSLNAQNSATKSTPGINVEFMDQTVKPSNDFFNYVNGTWLKTTEIPKDRSRWGSFDELRKKTDTDAMSILKDAAKNVAYKSNTDQGKAVNLFSTTASLISGLPDIFRS